MADEKPSRSNAVYQAAWEAKDFTGCVRALIKLTTPDGKSDLSQPISFANLVNAEIAQARELDVLPSGFPAFNEKIVRRWLGEERIRAEDRKFVPFLESALLRLRDPGAPRAAPIFDESGQYQAAPVEDADVEGLHRCFALNAYQEVWRPAHENLMARRTLYDKGYLADYMAKRMAELHLTPEKLAVRAGVYPTFMQAFLDGKLVPEGKALANLKRELTQSDQSFQRQFMDGLHEEDRKRVYKRLEKKPKELYLVQALGCVTNQSHMHDFIGDAFGGRFDEGLRYFNVQKDKEAAQQLVKQLRETSLEAAEDGRIADFTTRPSSRQNIKAFAKGISKAVHDKTGLYEKLILEFGLRKQYFEPAGQLLDQYVASGKTDFKDFFTHVAQRWDCSVPDVCRTMGIDPNKLTLVANPALGTEKLHEIADAQHFTTDQKHTLVALRQGKLGLGSPGTLLLKAQEILNDPDPVFASFSNNSVAQKIASMPAAAKAETIDKSLVPNALLDLLLERSDIGITGLLSAIGKSPSNQTPTKILQGEEPFLVLRRDSGMLFQADKAKAAAAFFTSRPKLAAQLGLAFMEIGKSATPDELFVQVRHEDITLGEMVRTIRLQHFMTKQEFTAAVAPENSASVSWLTRLEDHGEFPSEALAKKLAEFAYEDFPQARTKDTFEAALRGKAFGSDKVNQHAALLGRIEREIQLGVSQAGKPGAPTFATIIPHCTELIGDGQAQAFLDQLATPMAHSVCHSWEQGGFASRETANDIADLLVAKGMNSFLRDKLVTLATGRVPVYDASLLENLSPNSTVGQRVQAISTLREKQHITVDAIGEKLHMDPQRYSRIEKEGWFPESRNRTQRLSQIAGIAGMLVPESAENPIAQRTRLAQILGTAPPEVATGRNRGIV